MLGARVCPAQLRLPDPLQRAPLRLRELRRRGMAMTGIPLSRVDWWAVRPGPLTPPDPEACTCWWTRGEGGEPECGDDSCRCTQHCDDEGDDE